MGQGKSASQDAGSGGHAVLIDFGGMMDSTTSKSAFLQAAFTPSFAPFEFDQKKDVTPRTSFDVFSMASVISEILLGENLIARYLGFRAPGNPHSFFIDWKNLYNFLGHSKSFHEGVKDVARKKSLRHYEILTGLVAKHPDFLELWRHMWADDGSVRDQAADKMFQMFLQKAG